MANAGKVLGELEKQLKEAEAKKESGVQIRTPKQNLLDASKIQDSDKDHYYRYGNQSNADKMDTRLHAEGYELVPEAEAEAAGVRARVGRDMVLIRSSMADHDARVRDVAARNRERLESHETEVAQAIEGVVRALRDNHDIKVDLNRIMINEQ